MIDAYNWIDKAKRYLGFSMEEMKWLVVCIFIMAFIVGFNDGTETFNLANWLLNFLISIIAVAIAVFAHEIGHRIIGLEQGYKTTFKPFIYGLIAGLIMSFMSYGKIIFLVYGSAHINIIEKHRLGYFRYQLGYFHYGIISFFGPFMNIMLAVFFKVINIFPQQITHQLIVVNLIIAVTSMLPIPGTDGLPILFAGRFAYFVSFGAIVGIAIFLYQGFAWWVIILGAILAAVAMWLTFWLVIQKRL